jgi:hypothetical protein
VIAVIINGIAKLFEVPSSCGICARAKHRTMILLKPVCDSHV